MKKIYFKRTLGTLLFICAFLLSPCHVFASSTSETDTISSTTSFAVLSRSEALTFAMQYFKATEEPNAENMSMTRTGGYSLTTYVPNLNQMTLTENYNSEYGTNYGGTCLQTAHTQMLRRFADPNNLKTYQTIFNDTLNLSIEMNAFPSTEEGDLSIGTKSSYISSILDGMFIRYGSSLRGNKDTLNLMGTIRSEVNNNRPVFLHVHNEYISSGIGSHAVVVIGYEEFTINYTKKVRKYGLFGEYIDKAYSKYCCIAVVNNGWYSNVGEEDLLSDMIPFKYCPEPMLHQLVKVS